MSDDRDYDPDRNYDRFPEIQIRRRDRDHVDLKNLAEAIARGPDGDDEEEVPPMSRPEHFAPPHIRDRSMPLPDYVTPGDGVSRAGQLSAAAIVREYESVASEIESMGEELVEVQRRTESAAADFTEALRKLKETAQAYRDEGKRLFDQIESCSRLASSVSETADDLMRRLRESQGPKREE